MSAFGRYVPDTLVALQQRQFALEQQLKESARDKARRVIIGKSEREQWSSEETEDVLGALGLTP